MIGKVLYSYQSSFKGHDGSIVNGFKTGVLYRNFFDKPECREFWSRDHYSVDDPCRVVFSKTKDKWFVFPPEEGDIF